MSKRDYYEVLEVERTANDREISRAYRKLAMQYHPDRIQAKGMSPEFAAVAEDKFKEIQQAFDEVEKYKQRRTPSSSG